MDNHYQHADKRTMIWQLRGWQRGRAWLPGVTANAFAFFVLLRGRRGEGLRDDYFYGLDTGLGQNDGGIDVFVCKVDLAFWKIWDQNMVVDLQMMVFGDAAMVGNVLIKELERCLLVGLTFAVLIHQSK